MQDMSDTGLEGSRAGGIRNRRRYARHEGSGTGGIWNRRRYARQEGSGTGGVMQDRRDLEQEVRVHRTGGMLYITDIGQEGCRTGRNRRGGIVRTEHSQHLLFIQSI